MPRTRIKICGICSPSLAQAAADAGVDGIGLVFVPDSPRHVTIEQAEAIIAVLPPMVEPVGLFVDAPAEDILHIARTLGLRTVQLHGRERRDDIARLGTLHVIKSVPCNSGSIAAELQHWHDGCPRNVTGLLYDAPPPEDDALPGGTGERFDWNELAQLEADRLFDTLPPTILAGGLTVDNVAHAIATVHPYAVDVSSGVETARGTKDADLITAFCHAVAKADAG